jgi:hypothetical protein
MVMVQVNQFVWYVEWMGAWTMDEIERQVDLKYS